MADELRIDVPRSGLDKFCKRHHIRRLAFFGSVLREDFGPESDIDVLVEFEAGHTPSFFKLFDMEDELAELLGGRRVDIRTPEDLSRYFRKNVLSTAVVRYAA